MALVSLIKLAFWIFVLFLALSFFGISIHAIVNSPAGQENVLYIFGLLSHFWQSLMQAWQWSTEWIRPIS